MRRRCVGVYGGSFDPVHLGHLRPALEIAERLALDALHLVPLHVAVHRDQPQASATQRLAMLRAAVAGQPCLLADDRELRRDRASYMVDTLVSFRDEMPDASLSLILGADAFAHFAAWKAPERIMRLAHLVVMRRPGVGDAWTAPLAGWIAEREPHDAQALRDTPAGYILFAEVTQLDISSTAIRALLRAGRSPAYLLPSAVSAMIEAQALYRSDGGAE